MSTHADIDTSEVDPLEVIDCPYDTRFVFEYCFTHVYYAKVRISSLGVKNVLRRLVTRGVTRHYHEKVHFIQVDTPHGLAEMWINETVFDLLVADEEIVIRYQVGRRSRSVKATLLT